jgi:hypothetical protein
MTVSSTDWLEFLLQAAPDGTKIPPAFAGRISEFLAEEYDDASNVKDLFSLGEDGANDVFTANSGSGKMAGAQVLCARSWFKSMVAGPRPAPPGPSGLIAKKKGKAASVVGDSDSEKASSEDEGDLIGVVATRQDQLDKDLKAMRLPSGARVASLDLSTHAGSVLGEEHVQGQRYPLDVSMTKYALKVLRKTETVTLSALVKAGDAAGIRSHVARLIEKYNQEVDRTQEVTILSTFLTRTTEMFAGNDSGFVEYIKQYRIKYAGRAFPTEFDIVLFVKVVIAKMPATANLTPLKDDLAEAKRELKAVKKELDSVRTTMGNLVSQMKNKADKARSPGDGGGDRPEKACGYCKEFGHYARECPKKKADEAAAKEAEGDE